MRTPAKTALLGMLVILFFFLTTKTVYADVRKGLSDVNRDGRTNTGDTSFIGTYYGQTFPTGQAALADVNQDSVIDVTDLSVVGANSGYILSACELEDINNNGSVTSADLAIVNGYLGQSDTTTNMIADLNGDGSITSADVASVQACIPTPTPTPTSMPTPTPTTKLSDAVQSSGPTNPNIHTNWQHEVMAGPNYVGTPKFIDNQDHDVALFIDKSTHHDDMSVSFSQPSIDQVPMLPWTNALNTVSEIFHIDAVSAFNGYEIQKTDNPYILTLTYDESKLYGLPASILSISHYDEVKKYWKVIGNPMVIDQVKHTVSTTTNTFGYFSVTYPASVW